MEAFAAWVQGIVHDLGYPGLFVLILLESTLVPIPSELVMPFAGYMASMHEFSLVVILIINSVAALCGSLICYSIGRVGGKPFVLRWGKWFLLKPKDLEKTEAFFAKHGKATILIGRFLPVVRHVISIPAGIARMPVGSFALQTFLGSTIWGSLLICIGYFLGKNWEGVAKTFKRVDLLIGVGILLLVGFLVIRFWIRRKKERALTPTQAD